MKDELHLINFKTSSPCANHLDSQSISAIHSVPLFNGYLPKNTNNSPRTTVSFWIVWISFIARRYFLFLAKYQYISMWTIPELCEAIYQWNGEEIGHCISVFWTEHKESIPGIWSEGDGDGKLLVSASQYWKCHVPRTHKLWVLDDNIWKDKL